MTMRPQRCAIGNPPVAQWDDASELHPAPILPEQFFVERRIRLPEHRLMRAVLEKALADFDATIDAKKPGDRRLFAEVDQWFASDDMMWPGSFARVCDALGLDHAAIRASLRPRSAALQARRARGRASASRNVDPVTPTTALSEGRHVRQRVSRGLKSNSVAGTRAS